MIRRRFPTALIVTAVLATGVARAAPAPGAAVPFSVEGTDGDLTVRLTVSTAETAMGLPVALALRAEVAGSGPRDDRVVRFPDVAGALVEALGEDRAEVEGVRTDPDGRGVTGTLRLYDSGEFDLPELVVELRRPGAGNEPLAAVTLDGPVLRVPSVLPEEAGPAPVPVPARGALVFEPEVPPPLPPWALVAAGALLLAAGTCVLARRRRRLPPAPPPVPPHERARRALDDLEARRLPEQGAVDPYFTALSEILRHYLEDRFGLRAPEQTTEEFLAEVSGTDEGRRRISAAQREILRGFLTRADQVKFARHLPDVDACHAAGGTARQFVAETAPDLPPPLVRGASS